MQYHSDSQGLYKPFAKPNERHVNSSVRIAKLRLDVKTT